MVGQQVDRLAGLAPGLGLDPAGVAPLQREVLPEQHPGLVGRLVQLGAAHVGVQAQEVEPGVARPGPRPGPSPPGWPRPGPCGSAPGWRP